MSDLLITGGTPVDGTGAAPRAADVLVRGERIAGVLAPGAPVPGARAVDVAGCVVCPGFVDRPATAAEIDGMCTLLTTAFALFAWHLRDYADDLVPSAAEAARSHRSRRDDATRARSPWTSSPSTATP